jgi:hypothetical protein
MMIAFAFVVENVYVVKCVRVKKSGWFETETNGFSSFFVGSDTESGQAQLHTKRDLFWARLGIHYIAANAGSTTINDSCDKGNRYAGCSESNNCERLQDSVSRDCDLFEIILETLRASIATIKEASTA